MLLANLEANRNPGGSWPQNLRQVELQKSETAFVSFFFFDFSVLVLIPKHTAKAHAPKRTILERS
jgi:hypothetical protein